MEEQQIIDIWEMFKDYIVEKNRDTAAHQYIEFLVSQDVDFEIIEGLKGYDVHLDNAIELVLDQEKDDIDQENDNETWDTNEDEDEDY